MRGFHQNSTPTSAYFFSSPMIKNALLVVKYSFPAVRRHPGFFSFFVLFRSLKSKEKNVFASCQCLLPAARDGFKNSNEQAKELLLCGGCPQTYFIAGGKYHIRGCSQLSKQTTSMPGDQCCPRSH